MTLRPRTLLAPFIAAMASSCLAPDAVPGATDGSGGSAAGAAGAAGTTSGNGGTVATGGAPSSADLAWAHSYGAPIDVDQRALSVSTTADGHAIFAGEFESTLTFDGLPPLPNTVAHDAFVASFAPDGTPEWALAFDGAGEQRAYRAVATADGGVIVGGTFDTLLTLDGVEIVDKPEGLDGFVVSLAPDRSVRWTVVIHGPGDQAVHDLARTADGGVAVAGWFENTLRVEGLNDDMAQGGRDFFVARIDANGAPVWATSLGGDPADLPAEQPSCVIAVAGDASLRVAGTFLGAVHFDKDLTAVGDRDVFFGALDATGKPLWGHEIGAPSRQQRASGIAMGPQDHAVIAGDLRGEVTLPGGAALKSDGDAPDAFLVELDDKGGVLWGRRYGSAADDHGGPVVVDSGGAIVAAGRFRGGISFGDDPALLNNDASSAYDDIFLVKLGSDRLPVFSQSFGKDRSQVPTSLALAPAGDLFLAGYFDGVVDFGAGDLNAQAGSDVFIAKFGK